MSFIENIKLINSLSISNSEGNISQIKLFNDPYELIIDAFPTENYNLNFPPTKGLANQMLMTDNDGNLSWTDQTGTINDSSSSSSTTYSSDKINDLLTNQTHISSDITDFSSSVLTELNSQKNIANGIPGLDGSGKISASQLPSVAITTVTVVADIPARDALTPNTGDVCKVIDSDGSNNPQTYIYDGSSWIDIQETSDVISVNNQTGVVTLNTSHINENINLYYTEARVNANTNVSANSTHRTNSTIHHEIDDLTAASDKLYSSTKIEALVASGSNPFNQDLNTTDDVTFNDLDIGNKINFSGIVADIYAGGLKMLDFLNDKINLNKDLLPITDNSIDLGSSSKTFKDGYFSGDIIINTVTLDSSKDAWGYLKTNNIIDSTTDIVVNANSSSTFNGFILSNSNSLNATLATDGITITEAGTYSITLSLASTSNLDGIDHVFVIAINGTNTEIHSGNFNNTTNNIYTLTNVETLSVSDEVQFRIVNQHLSTNATFNFSYVTLFVEKLRTTD